jgi:hypothetical protein
MRGTEKAAQTSAAFLYIPSERYTPISTGITIGALLVRLKR